MAWWRLGEESLFDSRCYGTSYSQLFSFLDGAIPCSVCRGVYCIARSSYFQLLVKMLLRVRDIDLHYELLLCMGQAAVIMKSK